jgi:hypothetical protein
MTDPLYDHELDGLSPGPGRGTGVPSSPDVAAQPDPRGDDPGGVGTWSERLTLPELIGWSISLGALIALPLAVAARPGTDLVAVLSVLLLATPVVTGWRGYRRRPRPSGGGLTKGPTSPTSVQTSSPVHPAAPIPVDTKIPAVAGSRVRIRDDPDEGLRIDILGRPFLDESDIAPFVLGLLACFGIAGTVLVEGLRGKIPGFHPFSPWVVGPGLCGLALLAGNVLLMFVNETMVLDGEALVLASSLFGIRGARRLNAEQVGPLGYDPSRRRVTVPSTVAPWEPKGFGLRLGPDEAARIVNAVAAYRLRPTRPRPAGGTIRRVDPMRGLGRTGRRMRVTDERGGHRVLLKTPGRTLGSLMFLLVIANIAAATFIAETLETSGVSSRVAVQVQLAVVGLGCVLALLGARVLSPAMDLWLTARTDGQELELAHECGSGLRGVSRRLLLLLDGPLWFWSRKGARARGGRRTFRVDNLASIDTHQRYVGSDENVAVRYNLEIVRSDGSVFDLAAWLLPGVEVPKEVILFAQHLRDVLRVPGEDRVPSS